MTDNPVPLPYTFIDDPAFIAAFQKVCGQLGHDDPLEIFFQKWGEYQGKKTGDAEGMAHAAALFFDSYLPDMRGDRINRTRAQHLKKLREVTSEAEHPVSAKSIERFSKWMQPKPAEILYVAGGFHNHKDTSFKRIYSLIQQPELPRTRAENVMIDLYIGYVGEMLHEMEQLIQKTQEKMMAGQRTDTWAGAVKPANHESGINR